VSGVVVLLAAALAVALAGRGGAGQSGSGGAGTAGSLGEQGAVTAGQPAVTGVPLQGGSAAATAPDDAEAAFGDPTTVAAVLVAARRAVTIVDSYDYRHLQDSLNAGLAVTTGPFRDSYQQAMTGEIASTAPQQQTVQVCVVDKVGINALSADGALAGALVFASVTTHSATDAGAPQQQQVTLQLVLAKSGGSWLISRMSDIGTGPGPAVVPPGDPALSTATRAGVQAVQNLLTYGRATFEDDFSRAIGGLTSTLAQQQAANKTQIRASMATGGFDLVAQIGSVAVEEAGSGSVTLLVTARGYRVDDSGARALDSAARFEAVLTLLSGTWLLNQLTTVG
jgi:hypothetical protein